LLRRRGVLERATMQTLDRALRITLDL